MRHAVILAGGSGTRLWPASRRSMPKQFLPLGNTPGESLIAATARRLAGNRLVVVTAAEQAELVRAALPALDASAVIGEPCARNTGAALGLAAVHLLHHDPAAIMGAIPADQHVADELGFARLVGEAFSLAEHRDVIVTMGIVPTRAETGFGYLEVGDALKAGDSKPGSGPRKVTRFVEKPDSKTAETYLAAGNYLWNGGMFFVKAQVLLDEIERHMPETHRGLMEIRRALALGSKEAARATARIYPSLPSISIDYGVMERATGVLTIPADIGWNDVGSWSALADFRAVDEMSNIADGTLIACDAERNIAVADAGRLIALVGVNDLVVVQSGDAVIVIPRDRAQDVRLAVAELRKRKLEQFI